MATVVSLTQAKIQELMGGWEGVSLSQDEINALVSQLYDDVGTNVANLRHFEEVVKPQLELDVAGATIAATNAAEQIPALLNQLEQNRLTLETLNNQVIPALQEELTANIVNVEESPQTYVAAEPPEDPDENERYLVVGDTWYDTDDDNKQYIWNGTEWSTFAVDIPNLEEVILQYMSPGHAIYNAPVTGSQPVVNGANITPSP